MRTASPGSSAHLVGPPQASPRPWALMSLGSDWEGGRHRELRIKSSGNLLGAQLWVSQRRE